MSIVISNGTKKAVKTGRTKINWHEVQRIVSRTFPDHVLEKDLSRMANAAPRTLRYWKQVGKGPRGILLPRVWIYHKDDVARFLKERGAQ